MAQPCAKRAEGLRKASRAIASRFRGATLTSRIISPPLDYGHRLFPGSLGRSWGHAQIEQTISVGPNVTHHEEKVFGFGRVVGDEDFDPDYGEESHPDTHVRPHTRIVFRCARRHIAILP